MKLSQFKFNLPSELIALQPTQNRDEARLMVVDRRTGKIEHRVFKDLIARYPTRVGSSQGQGVHTSSAPRSAFSAVS